MSNDSSQIVRAIFVLLLVLVGLLEWMAAGSKFLVGGIRGDIEHWMLPTLVLLLLGAATFALSIGVALLRPWQRWLNTLLIGSVLAFAGWRMTLGEGVDVPMLMTFMLALLAQVGLAVWLLQSIPAVDTPGNLKA